MNYLNVREIADKCGVNVFLQSSHCVRSTLYSTISDAVASCLSRNFCIVIFTLINFECGSVHTNAESTICALFKPFIFDKHRFIMSEDSRSHFIQGGRM